MCPTAVRCVEIVVSKTVLFFRAMDSLALDMPSCECGTTSPLSQNTSKTKIGQQRQQISELQFDKLTTSFLGWKIRFKNQVTSCSDFPSEAMLWIKEVEMVGSLEELKSSR